MRVSSLRTGLIFIGTGIILLGNTLGYIDWFVWGDLLRLWPALLIAIGIELIFRRSRAPALAYLSPLIILLCFAYALAGDVVFADDGSDRFKKEIVFSISESELGDVNSLEYNINLSIGNFEFDAADSGVFHAKLQYYGSEPKFEFENDGGVGEIELSYRDMRKFKSLGRRGSYSYIYLDDRRPTKLDIDADVVDLMIDLRDVEVTDLNVDSGVSDIMVRFGTKADHVNANFDIGVSDLSVYIPEGTAVHMRKDTGLSSVSYKKLGLVKVSKGIYESPDYDLAPKKISLDIDAGVSDIDLYYYDSMITSL